MRPGWRWRTSAAGLALLLCVACAGAPAPTAIPTLLPLPTLTPAPANALPAPITAVTVQPAARGIQVSWPAVPGATFYMLTRRLAGGEQWSNVAMVDPLTEADGWLTFLDVVAAPGVRYEYAVAAANVDGVTGPPAVSPTVEWRSS